MRLAGVGLKRPLVRVLERRPLPPYRGGFGMNREQALGLPHFSGAEFEGAYPFAKIRFQDRIPGRGLLEAFNPMVPLDTENSSLPVAVLTYRLVSRAPAPLTVTLAFSAINPVGYDGKACCPAPLPTAPGPSSGRTSTSIAETAAFTVCCSAAASTGPSLPPRYFRPGHPRR